MTEGTISLLLEIAANINITVPETPEWYREEYFETNNIKFDELTPEIQSRLNYDVDVAWQTYHLIRCSTHLINSCEHIESANDTDEIEH